MSDANTNPVLPPGYYGDLADRLEEIVASFAPGLEKLKPEQTKLRNAVAMKRRNFIDLAREVAENDGGFIPSFMSLDEFNRNIGNMKDVVRIRQAIQLIELHTRLLELHSNNEALQNAFAIHGMVKFAARKGVLRAKPVYERLRTVIRGCSKPHLVPGADGLSGLVADSADDRA